jgi:hypothetical protein
MMNKVLILVVLAIFTVALVGCVTHTHVVGKGGPAKGGKEVKQMQWYAAWGLVDLNKIESAKMAGDASDYTIKTQYGPIDVLVNIFLGGFSIYSRTVTVIK